ncbi:disease resistance protein Roq1-like [Gastrolobium bilobum]|uniref:disease resistance protein Roq1-like n=1 Tax=Gastrolobium bilobum TaxID=150636 RepID=UPI002AB305BD|nr:disease resistance protein Roq1-like [Gastrolobium bilobum]
MAQGSPSSPFTYTFTYDVFLNFRGEDTRTGFTGNLYSALSQRGVLTFIDDDGLKKGEEITPSLLHAIQKSRMAIVIFSKNYASSTFCLKELVQILECYTKQNMSILPVFYDVDPSEVRHQTGSYGEAFAKHEQGRFKDDKEKLQKWRLALSQAAGLSGWHFKHGKKLYHDFDAFNFIFKNDGGEYEHVFIKNIIEKVSLKLNRPLLHIANYPVGLKARIQHVWSLIGTEFNNKVTMIGIHGIGGIGKSIIARDIYNSVAHQFEGSCFLANVREKSNRHGLEQIQQILLSEVIGERNINWGDVNQGIPILKERLHREKVLLILDDVDKKEQLQAVAGGLDWFGSGSIIVITTRDKHLLEFHGIKKLYEVNEFNDTEALELFRWNALQSKELDASYMEIIKRAIYYANGLPLALETIGSNLFGKKLDEWKSALEAYERIPNRDIQEILKVSYNGLEENEKEIFLDMACFFRGCTVRYVTNMLHARGFHPKYGIEVLQKKSLIKFMRSIDDDEIVTMHDLIQYIWEKK